jgi:hypothetical protein
MKTYIGGGVGERGDGAEDGEGGNKKDKKEIVQRFEISTLIYNVLQVCFSSTVTLKTDNTQYYFVHKMVPIRLLILKGHHPGGIIVVGPIFK